MSDILTREEFEREAKANRDMRQYSDASLSPGEWGAVDDLADAYATIEALAEAMVWVDDNQRMDKDEIVAYMQATYALREKGWLK